MMNKTILCVAALIAVSLFSCSRYDRGRAEDEYRRYVYERDAWADCDPCTRYRPYYPREFYLPDDFGLRSRDCYEDCYRCRGCVRSESDPCRYERRIQRYRAYRVPCDPCLRRRDWYVNEDAVSERLSFPPPPDTYVE